jgi:hypothetical protein
MSTLALMPMRMSLDTVAPAYPRRASWLGAVAPVSTGFGGGFGSFECVTSDTDQANEIDTKAHGHRRLRERPA